MPTRALRRRSSLHTRLARRLPSLLGLTLEQVTSEVEFYRHLHADQVQGDVAEVTLRNLQLFVRMLREGRAPEVGEIDAILRSAASRAEDRIPLPELLSAYYAGAGACWDQLRELVEAGDAVEVVEIGALLLSYLRLITSAVTETYVETMTALHGREREARIALLERVLAGEDDPLDWEQAGLAPWRERTVLALRYPAPRHGDEVTDAVEARRRARCVREALMRATAGDVLDGLSADGGIVVLPGGPTAAHIGATLAEALEGPWHATLADVTSGPDTAEALTAARDCVEVAARLGLPAGMHRLDDLLLEVQVTRPGPARTRLRAVLAPLEGHPDLTATLAAHAAAGGRRAEAARLLHVHANTLDYRLRRIRELTGLDPADRAQGQLLQAAVVVQRYLDAL